MLPELNWIEKTSSLEEKRSLTFLNLMASFSELWDASTPQVQPVDPVENWKSIYLFQTESLNQFLSGRSDQTETFNRIQNSAWQFGKLLSEKDWPNPGISNPFEAYLALSSLKVGALKNSDCYVLERKTDTQCTFYWLSSPIESTRLCQIYHEFFRGYAYHLSRSIRLEIHSSILPSSEENLKTWKFTLLWTG